MRSYLKVLQLTIVVIVITALCYSYWRCSQNEPQPTLNTTTTQSSLIINTNDTIYHLGMLFQTDKVSYHRYDIMYERYFKEYRGKNLIVLEIGLGCGTPRVGASANLWRAYFGQATQIHVAEFDENCAKKWWETEGKKLNIIMHYGDQSDVYFLKTIIDSVPSKQFDIIIDDGGHTMSQEITTLHTLISTVSSGGLYIIEDLETSYMKGFGGDPSEHANHTMITLLKRLMDDFQDANIGPKWFPNLMQYVYSYEIGPGIVFLRIKN